jgi:hypothetical protein
VCGQWFLVKPFVSQGFFGGEATVRVVGEELAEEFVARLRPDTRLTPV